jgi:hypothetical protein
VCGQIAERLRLLVRLPSKLIVGETGEHAAGGCDFSVEVREGEIVQE